MGQRGAAAAVRAGGGSSTRSVQVASKSGRPLRARRRGEGCSSWVAAGFKCLSNNQQGCA
eukprot:2136432-Rhodomonas_salina.2